MYKVDYFDASGAKQGVLEFDLTDFPEKPNKKFLHQVVVLYEGNLRHGTASTKGRSEVEGSTKKPWRQKGLGRARVGSIRSPIWRHGGVVFGPKPRSFYTEIPRKMKQNAVKHALVGKLNDNEIKVIDAIKVEGPKTKFVSGILKNVGLKGSTLLVCGSYDKNLYLSARNINKVDLMPSSEVNSYKLLKNKYCLMTMDAFEALLKVDKSKLKQIKGKG